MNNCPTDYVTANKAMENEHAFTVLTEWDEFKTYDWEKVYEQMYKPAFLFDGRDIFDRTELLTIGFKVIQHW